MQTAMRDKDSVRLDTLRMLISALTVEIKRTGKMLVEGLPDNEVVAIIRKEMKKREEAGQAYLNAGRQEAAEKEAAEYKVLMAYVPPLMSEDAIREVALKKQQDLGITDPKQAGILMGRVMKELAGKADGPMVKKVIDSLFA